MDCDGRGSNGRGSVRPRGSGKHFDQLQEFDSSSKFTWITYLARIILAVPQCEPVRPAGVGGCRKRGRIVPGALVEWGVGMDRLRDFLDSVRDNGLDSGHFLGLLHLLIGRKITDAAGNVVSSGVTWRELAALLKRVRWERESVRELGLDPASLSPRDRERFWYQAISQANLGTTKAQLAGDELALLLIALGYQIIPPPKGG